MIEKPLCFVEITLHPEAEKQLSEYFSITKDFIAAENAEAMLIYSFPDDWASAKMSKLKAIGCHSISKDAEKWAQKNDIQVTKADLLWTTVAEHTLALCMSAARMIPQSNYDVKTGNWLNHTDLKEKYSGHSFCGKTFGIWGMGKIGRELAGLLSGFKMDVLYNDIVHLPHQEETELGVTYVSFENLLIRSDYFCILVPLNDDTKGMFGKKQFELMKRGCVFVNTARAGIIDKDNFFRALDEGIIGAAALDVLWEEGVPQSSKMLEYENVIITPHLGGSTYECDMELIRGIIDVINNE